MSTRVLRAMVVAAVFGVCPLASHAQSGAPVFAQAELFDAGGKKVGTVNFTEMEGQVTLQVDVEGLPEGEHGFHFHETGSCTPPDFASAGGHFNPANKQHGMLNPQGHHAGDLPNIKVGADGKGKQEITTALFTLSPGANSLADADGSAAVVHAQADDLKTDPSGNSGARIACGIVKIVQ
jgi:superoxide dismutase, Cu-Zn family